MQPTPATASGTAPPEGGPEGGLTPSEARLQRNLKIIVVAMGLLIFAGLATIVGRIIYLASGPAAQPPAADAGPASGAGAAVADRALTLPAGAVVRSISLSGDRLAVHYEAAGTEGIAVLDLASGRVLTRVDLPRGGNSGD